jgi:ABC-type sugar transport system substrate-binding protein
MNFRAKLVALGAVAVLVASACSSTGTSPSPSAAVNASAAPSAVSSAAPVTIGVVLSFTDFFYAGIQRAMDAKAKELGATNLFVQTNTDATKEADAVANFIARKVNVIAMAVTGGDSSVATLQSAAAANIPVICYDGCIPAAIGPTLTKAFVLSDQTGLGKGTGEVMKAYIEKNLGGKAKIGTLNCNVFPETCGKRFAGMKAALAGLPGVEFVADQEGYVADKSQTVAENMLTGNKSIDILWASNEGGTVGAVNAVVGQGKADKVKVFGTDISPQLAKFLQDPNGVLMATTGQDAEGEGTKATELAVMAANGEPITPWAQVVPVVLYDRSNTALIDAYVAANPR